MNLPLVWLTLFYAAGIVIGAKLPAALPWLFLGGGGTALAAAAAARRSSWFDFLLGLALVFLGAFAAQRTLHLFPADHISRLVAAESKGTVRGIVREKPSLQRFQTASGRAQTRVRLTLEATAIVTESGTRPARGKVALSVYRGTAARDLMIGEEVEARGARLRPVPEERRSAFLLGERMLIEATVWGNGSVRPLGKSGRFGWRRRLADAGEFLERKIAYGLEKSEHRQIVCGLVFGSRGGFSPELTGLFLRTNTYHVLAVSGFNMMLAVALMTALLRLLRLPRRAVAAVMIAVIFGYTAVIGFPPSACRAGLMSALALLAWAIDREAAALNTVAASALVILLFSPLQLFSAGFQLSYVVVLGLVFWAEPLARRMEKRMPWPQRFSRWKRPALTAAAASVIAWAIVLLPILHRFGTFTPYSVATNLVILFFVSALTYLGLAALLFNLASENLGIYLNEVNALLADALLAILRFFEKLPGAYWELPKLPVAAVILFYFAMLVPLCVKMSPQRPPIHDQNI